MPDNFTYPALTGYMAGCNLGGWISQYGSKDADCTAHFDSYVTESDLSRIAAWGMDHVRLPVDYFFFESDERPYQYSEERLSYVDRALAWAKKYRLNVVLDLHCTAGFDFLGGDDNDLLQNAEQQKRYLAIWEMFAKRYAHEGDNLRFDLLNEMVCDADEVPLWDVLWQKAAAAIHAITPERGLFVGGNHNNQVFEMANLTYVDNPHIYYTFHMYEPFLFTHQRATSSGEYHASYQKQVTYPYRFDDHREYYYTRYGEPLDGFFASMEQEQEIGRHFVETFMEPAVEFIRQHNRPVYIGEYGTTNGADDESIVRWLNDIADICLQYGIGRTVWSHRSMTKLLTKDDKVYDQRIIDAVSRK